MSNKMATRDAYGKALAEFAEQYDLYVFDADLAAATKTGTLKDAHPDRFFDCGIAEGNMMGVAAGMAASGKTVFASSFAMFAAGRAFEQVRNSIGYPHLNVKIGATHAGLSVGEDGATHQCNEDIALMRTIPGMVVMNPADDTEARLAVLAAYNYEGPVYIRFGRLAVPVINDPETYEFEIGKAVTLKDGSDVTIVSTGLMTARAMEAVKMLEAEGINARLINVHTLKPFDAEAICKAARETGGIVTAEEHSVVGGLYTVTCEALIAGGAFCPVKPVAVMDEFGQSGPAEDLLKLYGLTAENIVAKVHEILDNK